MVSPLGKLRTREQVWQRLVQRSMLPSLRKSLPAAFVNNSNEYEAPLTMKRKQFVTALAFGLPMSTILTHHSLPQAAARQRTIVLGQVGLSFYQVKAALIQILLERLGYRVTVREGPHEQIISATRKG